MRDGIAGPSPSHFGHLQISIGSERQHLDDNRTFHNKKHRRFRHRINFCQTSSVFSDSLDLLDHSLLLDILALLPALLPVGFKFTSENCNINCQTASSISFSISVSNFKCLMQPPRLVWSLPPSGYILPRYPPVACWGGRFIFFQSVFWETP